MSTRLYVTPQILLYTYKQSPTTNEDFCRRFGDVHTTEKRRTKDDAYVLTEKINGKHFTVVWRYLQPNVNAVISTRISGVATIRQECAKIGGPQIKRAHETSARNYFYTNLTSPHTSGKFERIREDSDSRTYLQD